ncbi:LacI family DNA-binding transcriptional regulator [Rhodopseudomonas sp. P2A-2r]|uniref:LacI family DNA-binding transcriptional regulator n=1 Tax=unclassified Rhodopseudomonas TaxID=2638247 RepID=UPI002234C4AA|nr:LacI family DNA-binding transcriptional regulator [Rhodopseudomonas sp. P2A-2r]UZE50698.1 LacI family transcriptional regulator [Rhodopseudomonas sp. P2A-2r]
MDRAKKKDGKTPPRIARATIIDVAERAGVHWSTVSRALNPAKRHLISAEMIERISACVEQLGYRQNAMASALRTQKTRTIGVIVSNLGDPIHPPIVRAIEDRFGEIGYVAFVGNTDNDSEREAALIDRFIAQGVDGLIVATFKLKDPLVDKCLQAGVPTVAVFRDPQRPEIPSVRVDDGGAMAQAVRHLVGLGHRHIAHVGGPQNVSTGRNRYRGFVRAHRASFGAGRSLIATFGKAFTVEDGRAACDTLLERHPSVTAIVAGNDMLAIGCLSALNSRTIRCPDDISLVGMNDMLFMDAVNPPLTTMRTPSHDLGRKAADLLIGLIEGKAIARTKLVLPSDLIVRASSRALL